MGAQAARGDGKDNGGSVGERDHGKVGEEQDRVGRPEGGEDEGDEEEAVDLACEVLREWQIEVTERLEPLAIGERIGPGELNMPDYEAGRPILGGAP